MVRRDEHLHVSVPPNPDAFRCPISMDVMRSPVSLITGVTYDRSNIQLWLDSGHDTCPATMLPLPSKDFVPNLNLRRLISLWGPLSPATLSPTLSDLHLRSLLHFLAAENDKVNHTLLTTLSKMLRFAESKPENRAVLAGFNGFVSGVVGVLNREGVEIEVIEKGIRLLDLIRSESGVVDQLRDLILVANRNCLSSFQLVLRNGRVSSKIESARFLESIAFDADSKRMIAEKDGMLTVLSGLLTSETEPALHVAAFSLLGSLLVTRSTKTELVQSGMVRLITETLSDRDVNVALAEKAMRVLAKIATCAEGRAKISKEAGCVGAVTGRLMKGTMVATEDGVAVLWSVCCMLGDKRGRESVRRGNGVTKILLVMQSGYGEGHIMRRMCGDLIKVLSVGLGMGLSYDTISKHIMPC